MENIIRENSAWIEETFNKTEQKMRKKAVKSRDKIPYTVDENGVHDDCGASRVEWWTNGFWGGMMWLLYNATGCEEYKITAKRSEEILNKALLNYDSLHHDVGFMWHLTSGADYRLTGDKSARNTNLFAAATLYSRFNVDAKFIRAWNNWSGDDTDNSGWSIIDCLMNIPLLYWASKEIGDDRFKKVAMHHADMSVRDHIRADGSVNHIVNHDTSTGEMLNVFAGQGCSETSCWTRGLAWAIYGITLSFIHTGKKEYLDAAIRSANFFVANISRYDYKTPVDFRQPETPDLFDSTAGVCTACGLLELAKLVSPAEAKTYTDVAIKVLKATAENFCRFDMDVDYLVGMGTGRYPTNKNLINDVHIPIIYGDFFFVEALTKLKGRDFLIW